jgi:outer membrane protein
MKKTGRLFIIINLLILLTGMVSSRTAYAAGEAKAYTIDKSIKTAFENNWSVKTREEQVSESEYIKDGARAAMLPELSTSYSYTRLNNTTMAGQELEMGDHNNYQWAATITQPIFKGHALTSAFELSKLGIDQARVAVELEKLDLALRVKEAYFNILKADKSVGVANSSIESLESQLEVEKSFYNVGRIPINDLLKAEVKLANARHSYIKARNEAMIARVSFNKLLSRPVDESFEIEDTLVYIPENPDYDASLEKALKARPEIKALKLSEEQLDQLVKQAKSRYYPDVTFSSSYIKAGDTPNVSGSNFQLGNQWRASVGVSLTLWDWGKTRSSVNQIENQKKQLSNTFMDLEETIGVELKKSIINLKEAEEKIPTAKKAVEQAQENLRVNELRYKVQMTTATEVLDAQQLLAEARENYYNAIYDHILAKAVLLRAIGEY